MIPAAWDLALDGDATVEHFPDRCYGWGRAIGECLTVSYTGESAWGLKGKGIWEHDGVIVPLSTTDDLRRLGSRLCRANLAAQVRSAAETYDVGIDRLVLLPPPISIDEVEDLLEELEAALDDLLDAVEESPSGGDRGVVAILYECAGQMEDVVDGLEYIASRVRLYAHDSVQAELAEQVREVALCAAGGARSRYIGSVHNLLECVLTLQEGQIHADAAGAIRSRGDRLLRLHDGRTTDRSLDLDANAALLELGIDASWGIAETDSAAPSHRRVANQARIDVEAELGGLGIELGMESANTDYLDSIKDASDAEIRRGDMHVESEVEGRKVRIGIEVSCKRSPGDVDGQFALGSETVARSDMKRLQMKIENAGLPDEVTMKLANHLEAALLALSHGDLEGGAVDHMEDLIDEVNDLVWEGSLPPSAGDGLVSAAWEILPKRVEREWTAPASLALDMGSDGSLDVDVSIGRRRIPTNPRLDTLRETGSLNWQSGFGWADVEAGMERNWTEYRNDSSKTKHRSQTVYAIQWGQQGWTVDYESSNGNTAYPHAPNKDKQESNDALCVSYDADWIAASFELERSVVRYPNDRNRQLEDRRDREFEVDCSLGAAGFELSVSCTRYLNEAGYEFRVRRVTGLAADWAPSDSLQLDAELKWQRDIEWASPEGDSSSLSLSVSFNWSL